VCIPSFSCGEGGHGRRGSLLSSVVIHRGE
jgi:hypothetical protein